MNIKINCIKCHDLIYPHEEMNGLCKKCRLENLSLKEDSKKKINILGGKQYEK